MSNENSETVVTPKRTQWVLCAVGLVVLVGAVVIVKHNQQSSAQTQLQQQILQQAAQISAMQKQIDAQQQKISDFDAVSQTIEKITQATNTKTPSALTQYQLLGVEQLLRLANQAVQLEHEPLKALRLLEAAQQELTNINNPALESLQTQISNDITQLKAVSAYSSEAVFNGLSSVMADIEKLSFAKELSFQAQETSADSPEAATDSFWKTLEGYVRIKERDQPAAVLLTSEGIIYVKYTLLTLCQQAQWAVLHQEPNVYQKNLKQVQALINQYVNLQETQTQQTLKMVNELSQVQMPTTWPDLSASIKLLSNIKTATPEPAP